MYASLVLFVGASGSCFEPVEVTTVIDLQPLYGNVVSLQSLTPALPAQGQSDTGAMDVDGSCEAGWTNRLWSALLRRTVTPNGFLEVGSRGSQERSV